MCSWCVLDIVEDDKWFDSCGGKKGSDCNIEPESLSENDKELVQPDPQVFLPHGSARPKFVLDNHMDVL
jgi:hypothetical protein